ncbi:hypothetical protein BD408DRAFT_384802 [Parasitella parasitica]|nr:hypothetical protein BD408DRAFT_384802 [Parasitella parasitica]
MPRPTSALFSRISLAKSFSPALSRPTALQLCPSILTRVPVRSVHAAPKEYNGLQSAAHHFKRQRHMPYFLEYLMWVVFGSEALHLIWLKMDYKEYKEKTAHKTKLLQELIKRIENGEQIDDSLREEIKMVLMSNKNLNDIVSGGGDDDIDDEYLNNLIASTENQQVTEKNMRQKPAVDSTWIKEEGISVDADDIEKTNTQKKPFFL